MRTYLNFINSALLVVYLLAVFPLWCGYLWPSTPSSKGALKKYIENVRHQSHEKAQIRTINFLIPEDYRELMGFLNTPDGRDPLSLIPYVTYFRTLAEVLPAPYSADAYAVLGFCYSHQNKDADAFASYAKSLQINPAFIWTYYNLALINFQEENFGESVELIERMISLNPELSLRIIASSKIYSDILRDQTGIDLDVEIKKTYADALRILVISQYRLKKFPEVAGVARYAIQSGFGPVDVFNFYASLAAGSDDDRQKADEMFKDAAMQNADIFTGKDLSVRFF
jgi:tetratricopeptide (TPR) repeat protein